MKHIRAQRCAKRVGEARGETEGWAMAVAAGSRGLTEINLWPKLFSAKAQEG